MSERQSRPAIERALRAFPDRPVDAVPPERLPLLNRLREHLGAPTAEALTDVELVMIQHQLIHLAARIRTMLDVGLDPARAWFVDIPYSTNGAAREALWTVGCREEQTTTLFQDPLARYSKAQLHRVTTLLRSLADRRRGRRLLVVDDGAYFLRALNEARILEPALAESFRGTRIVEQTTRGHRYIYACAEELVDEFDLTVVSIARCKTKLEFESPFVGAAVSRAVKRAAEAGRERVGDLRNVSVLGFGAVGRATTEALRRWLPSARIDVVEPDKAAHDQIRMTRATPLLRLPAQLPADQEYDLVAGCTGYNSFKLQQRSLLAKKALLVSGSSAAVEFNRAGFVELADSDPDDEIEVMDRQGTIARGIHAPITIGHESAKEMCFLNAGFPANFDGLRECLPFWAIQPTHGLLFAAAVQALAATWPGTEVIDPQQDEWIFDVAIDELGSLERH